MRIIPLESYGKNWSKVNPNPSLPPFVKYDTIGIELKHACRLILHDSFNRNRFQSMSYLPLLTTAQESLWILLYCITHASFESSSSQDSSVAQFYANCFFPSTMETGDFSLPIGSTLVIDVG